MNDTPTSDTPTPPKLSAMLDPYENATKTSRYQSYISEDDFNFLRLLNPSPKCGIHRIIINTITARLCTELRAQDITTYLDYDRFLKTLDGLNFGGTAVQHPSVIAPSTILQPQRGTPIAITHTEASTRNVGRGTSSPTPNVAASTNVGADTKKPVAKRGGRSGRSNVVKNVEGGKTGSEHE